MKLAFYTPNYPGITGAGGIGSYTRGLALELARRGHQVHVLTPGHGSKSLDGQVWVHCANTSHLPLVDRFVPGASACWKISRAMKRLAREHSLDLVEFPNWEGRGVAFLKSNVTPVVVRLHTSTLEAQLIDGEPPTRLRRWDVKREQEQARLATALVTHSQAHRAMMSDELGMDSSRIELIPHGVEIDPAYVRPRRQPGPARVVFLGRLEKRKGTPELLEAIPRVLARHPETHFTLIGQDRPHCPGNRTHARWIAEELPADVRGRITLLGSLPQEAVTPYLQQADVFVAPSRYESFGLVFPEAMRWETPVLGARAGGIPEIIQDGITGILVEPQDPSAIAEGICRLLSDVSLRHRLGVAGRRHVEANFSLSQMASRVLDLYQRVFENKLTSNKP